MKGLILAGGWWKDMERHEDVLDANHLILEDIKEENFGEITK